MRSNYKRMGDYIQLVDERNTGLKVTTLLGLTISKQFIPSVANTIGTDMENYKIIRRNQFACSTMQVRRDRKMPVALLQEFDEAIISPAYPVFEVIDPKKLLPEYLMMWFSRSEFDREALFYAVGGVRGSLEWEDFCNMTLPIPSPDKQQEIVREYNTILQRVYLNKQLIQKLEETAQAIYEQWFVEFEFPNENGEPYKSAGGAMAYSKELDKEIPKGWEVKPLKKVVNIVRGSSPRPIEYYISTNSSDMPWVKIADATASATKYITSTKEYIKWSGVDRGRKVFPGSLILSISGDPGLPAIIDIKACVHDGWIVFNDYKDITQEFLYLLLLTNRSNIASSGYGSVITNIKSDTLRDYKIAIPDQNTSAKATTIFQPIDNALKCAAKIDLHMNNLLGILLSKMATAEG